MLIHYFLLVQSATKQTKVLFVGQVKEKEGKTINEKFMHRHSMPQTLSFPEEYDASETERDDIILTLPQTISSGQAVRTQALKPSGTDFLSKKKCSHKEYMHVYKS
jgi:ssRNA-specific RNase YbeY (16S rRNA maturation enzyme)